MQLDLDFFEQIFLYKAFTDDQYAAAVVDLYDSEYLHDGDHRLVGDIFHEYYTDKGKRPSLTEVKQYCTSDRQKAAFKKVLLRFKELDKSFDEETLYHNTERFLKERAVYKTMLDVADDISQNKIDTSSILDQFESSCAISLETDLGLNLYDDHEAIVKQMQEEQQATIPGPWPWLNDLLAGGFQEKGRAIYVVAGETNVGKSIVLGNIGAWIAQKGKTVLLISLEMSELMYARRMYANLTGMPANDIPIESATFNHRMESVKDTGGRLFVKEFPPSTITPNQLKAFITKVQHKVGRIDAIVVDYINLLASPVGTNSYERVKYCTEQLRAMSYVFECPMITATQLNRSGFDTNDPGFATISESIGLAMTADVIWTLWQQEDDREVNLVRMSMLKNRFGPNFGTSAFAVNYETLTIEETDIEIDDEEETEIGTLRSIIDGN